MNRQQRIARIEQRIKPKLTQVVFRISVPLDGALSAAEKKIWTASPCGKLKYQFKVCEPAPARRGGLTK